MEENIRTVTIELIPEEIEKYRKLSWLFEKYASLQAASIKSGSIEQVKEFTDKVSQAEAAYYDFIFKEVLPRAQAELKQSKYQSKYPISVDDLGGKFLTFEFVEVEESYL